jgi:hypothetical protein
MCLHKETYVSKKEAEEAVSMIYEFADEVQYQRKRNSLRAYKCDFCSKYHIGHRTR